MSFLPEAAYRASSSTLKINQQRGGFQINFSWISLSLGTMVCGIFSNGVLSPSSGEQTIRKEEPLQLPCWITSISEIFVSYLSASRIKTTQPCRIFLSKCFFIYFIQLEDSRLQSGFFKHTSSWLTFLLPAPLLPYS